MTSIQPELWVDAPREALAFYEAAFVATVLHLVGEGDDIVAQLGVGDAAFWVAPPSSTLKRLSPRAIDGATGRTLLVVEDLQIPFDLAVALLDHADWLIPRDRRDEAEPLISEAAEIFERLGAKPWLERTSRAKSPLPPVREG